jgi:type I restriction enzyme R subunit
MKKKKLNTKWRLCDPKRIALIAADLVTHFKKRTEAMDGKAIIVCISRRIRVEVYEVVIKLRHVSASSNRSGDG